MYTLIQTLITKVEVLLTAKKSNDQFRSDLNNLLDALKKVRKYF